MDRLDELLEKTSRTFALSIPLLPDPTRRHVGIAYLLFRIADTFEDAALWDARRKTAALGEFADLLRIRGARIADRAARWLDEPPVTHAGYLELLRATPDVLAWYWAVPEARRAVLERNLRRTAQGMAEVVGRGDGAGAVRLEGLRDLRRYCYIVAGIVGEMLSELYVLDWPALAPSRDHLARRAPFFGEALQLVNILKDSATDLFEGRRYLPEGVDRAEVFAIARRDLEYARQYVEALRRRGAPDGLVAFNALPALLAEASLDRIDARGPGAKLMREEVAAIAADMGAAISSGRPPISPSARGHDAGRRFARR